MSTKPRIFCPGGLRPVAVEQLARNDSIVLIGPPPEKASRAEILQLIRENQPIHGLVGYLNPVNDEVLDACGPELKVVSTPSVGFDHISVPSLASRSVRLGHSPSILNHAVAETCVLLVLATLRKWNGMQKALKSGDWSVNHIPLGNDLRHLNIGIIGLGRVGLECAYRLAPFGCVIRYTDIRPVPVATVTGQGSLEYVPGADLLAEKSDMLVVACDLNASTRGMVGERLLRKLRGGKGGWVVNVGRGPVVDQDALVRGLKEGWVQGAGLDVMDPEPLPPNHELLSLENAVLLPHQGTATVETRDSMALMCVENGIKGAHGQLMPAEIDMARYRK
ncbi:hypothetical protein M427DRAFT_145874 [Gonapodya prolifera JEL478]|uniref:Glyoxylate reductase n=1 Tax=Gonapodya prolifera (strain JEL478) TaxID=1344416 RepID=A0A139ADC2_GONPJ|nr:hypothetical protein M427DRAFT_145874 [Gonapodya prolifera JEL478]|eukprot:KXS14659.1 hypothetical protein M427DRAFT_145874 [Gonapodya prolifera JEL478]